MIRPPRHRHAHRRVPTLLAALGAFALLAGCGATTGSAPPPTGEPPPATNAPGEVRACTAQDLQVSSTGWGGAAGSRGADVSVQNGSSQACTLDGPRVAVLDARGSVLLESEGESSEAILEPGTSSAFAFMFSNWCEPGSALPLQVALAVGGELVLIDALAMPTVDDLPPCNGEGQPASLSTIPWAQG